MFKIRPDQETLIAQKPNAAVIERGGKLSENEAGRRVLGGLGFSFVSLFCKFQD